MVRSCRYTRLHTHLKKERNMKDKYLAHALKGPLRKAHVGSRVKKGDGHACTVYPSPLKSECMHAACPRHSPSPCTLKRASHYVSPSAGPSASPPGHHPPSTSTSGRMEIHPAMECNEGAPKRLESSGSSLLGSTS
jgi:hypothetical protein